MNKGIEEIRNDIQLEPCSGRTVKLKIKEKSWRNFYAGLLEGFAKSQGAEFELQEDITITFPNKNLAEEMRQAWE